MSKAQRSNTDFLSRSAGVDGSLRVLSDDGSVLVAEMSIDEWLAVPGHSTHRPGSGQAIRSQWEFVRKAQSSKAVEDFRQVVVGEYDGHLVKITGHERTRLWEQGSVPMPRSVFVQLYRVTTRDELNRLYETFNAPVSEAQYDKVAIAIEAHGLQLKSKRLRYGYILNALNIALRGDPRAHQDKKVLPPIDVFQAIGVFREELLLLDSVDPKPNVFYNGVVAAALIALSLNPGNLEFFGKLSAREGSKVDGRMDPVESILDLVAGIKSKRSAWISAAQQDLCGRVLRACEVWTSYTPESDQYWFRSTVRPMDFTSKITEMKQRKRIVGEVEL